MGNSLSSLEISKTKKVIEFIKHFLGLCGENHISLLNFSPFLFGILIYISYIRYKIKITFLKYLTWIKSKLWKTKN